jgi:hypothetical protein
MDEKELLNKIKELVYAVPGEIYKYPKPDMYWDDKEWATTVPNEKGFILIKELIENVDIQKYKESSSNEIDLSDVSVLDLGKGPTFWNQADENMFFNAIYSMASYVKIKGEGKNLYLYYRGLMTNEEKFFLVGLLKRFGMTPPKELKK